jgi:hypothetical protein
MKLTAPPGAVTFFKPLAPRKTRGVSENGKKKERIAIKSKTRICPKYGARTSRPPMSMGRGRPVRV